jgi:hypothetical protein
MEFLKKAELFFIQLQYCLTIEPLPILQAEKGMYSISLEPDIFFKLINDFQIEYPFSHVNKIIELKAVINKEGINRNDALKVIETYKKQYWFFDNVIMFEPVTDKLIWTLKKIDIDISEKDINIELINYRKYLQEKRESFYNELIHEVQSLPTQQTENKADKLKEQLDKYGFFELPAVKLLSEIKQKALIDLISKNKMPYGIAMFDFLGFCEYLDNQQGTKYKADIVLSRFFNEKAKDGTSAKHYRRSLIKNTSSRYKAGEYTTIVQRDYEELK